MINLIEATISICIITAVVSNNLGNAAPDSNFFNSGVASAKEADEPDKLKITKATYDSDARMLRVLATSSFGSSSVMTVSIDGTVAGAPMAYSAATKRYEYVMVLFFGENMSGKQVMISSDKGGSHSAIIK